MKLYRCTIFPPLVLFVGFEITDMDLEQKQIKGTWGHKLDNFDIRTDDIKL